MIQADYVVSVAKRKTLNVWKVTAQALLTNLPATKYELIVPAADVAIFRKNTPSEIAVSSEDDFVEDFVGPLRDKIGGENPWFGWYLQQLIKLEALRRHADLSRLVVWDADTVPLRPLELFTDTGEPVFYRGQENHGPYFDAITKLLGLDKDSDFSFVAQCMPLKGAWAKEFFADVETRHGSAWWEPIIDVIHPTKGSTFSEYETLGTFFHKRFGPLHFQQNRNWSRKGYFLVSSPSKLRRARTAARLAKDVDYVAFEEWNHPRHKKRKRRLRNLFRRIVRHPRQ